jgi:hypothetical protein
MVAYRNNAGQNNEVSAPVDELWPFDIPLAELITASEHIFWRIFWATCTMMALHSRSIPVNTVRCL